MTDERECRHSARKRGLSAFLYCFVAVFAVFSCIAAMFGNTHSGQAKALPYSSSVVMEASTGRVLYSENADVRMYPASTTKILTALVVLENLPLGCKVEIAPQAVGTEGSSIYLRKGEVLTVEELLLGLMLRSGNDAACALAYAVSGNPDAFAALMNEKARACGAVNSNFVNPHGLHDENHYTTARDLALITAAAYRNADFRRIVSTKNAVIGGAEGKRYLSNKNKLLTSFDGANGVKTGYTTKSGRCLVGGAYRDGMQLISVVLNVYDMWNVSKNLLGRAFEEYSMQPVTPLPVEGADMEVEVKRDSDGNLLPSVYPVKKDGSEKISFVVRP